MDRDEMIERYARFFREYVDDEGKEVYINKLRDLLTIIPRRSLSIDWMHLNSYDPELAEELIENPEESINAAEDAIQIVLREPPILKKEEFRVHARFFNLPHTLLVKELASEHINRLVQVEGIITRVSEVKPYVAKAVYVCKDCGNEMIRLQRPYQNIVKPMKCDACGSRNLELDVDKSRFVNFQSFRLQDRPESLKGGQMPRFVDAILLDDMVDTALPGDRVLVTGILRVILEQKDKRPIFKKVLEVNHIEPLSKEIEELEITPEDEQRIRELAKRKDVIDVIVDSIAPAIWGYKDVKKGIALALFGGVQKVLPDGTKLRGESHVLLVGDPGVAKSQLLRYVANLAPRAIYTSGKSSSAAGLTAAAVRDEFTGSWVLEAGVLVLADGGFACLHPDSRVLVDGKYQRIEDLFELGKSYKALSDGQIVDIQEKEMDVVALDLEGMRTKTSKATIIRRKPWKGELLRIKLRSGNEVTLTPDHLLIDGQTLEWKEAEEFRTGDFIMGVDEGSNPLKDEIVSIEKVPYEGYVYDLYVPKDHNFVAEGIIVHNCIDEFDKMSERDRSAIHEALEQQSYHKDFELLLADGRKVKIGELVDSLIESNRERVIEGNDTEILPVENLHILAYDIDRREIVKLKAARVSRHKAPGEFIVLRFSNGREIEVTPEHPVMIWENGKIAEKKAEQIEKGDLVIGVKSYPPMGDSRNGRKLALSLFDEKKPYRFKKGVRIPSEAFTLGRGELEEFVRAVWERRKCKLSDKDGIRFPNRELAEDFQDILLILGIPSSIRGSGMSYTVVPCTEEGISRFSMIVGERTVGYTKEYIPGEIARSILRAARILRLKIPLREQILITRPLVIRENLMKIIQRVKERLESYERKLDKGEYDELLNVISTTEIYREYGITMGRFRKLVLSGDEWARDILKRLISTKIEAARKELEKVEMWLEGNIRLLRVTAVRKIKNTDSEWVYDITVEPYNLFVSHGLVLHNSISIAKAGITATLNARTTVIAAANPKYGRFNRHKPLPEQLDLPPTLLSRFDLIFLLLDEPDEKIDSEIAQHILKVRKGESEAVTPKVPYDLLKKYIAYARKNIHPVLTKEAMEELERYYVKMRKRIGGGSDTEGVRPIPITARQLEALIRLSEAHARMRLSEIVTRYDAREAIKIMEETLKKIAIDEEGIMDISILEVGKSSKKINKIDRLLEIIEKLQDSTEYGAPADDILQEASKAGISKQEARKLIEELIANSRIYEPRNGYYKIVG